MSHLNRAGTLMIQLTAELRQGLDWSQGHSSFYSSFTLHFYYYETKSLYNVIFSHFSVGRMYNSR